MDYFIKFVNSWSRGSCNGTSVMEHSCRQSMMSFEGTGPWSPEAEQKAVMCFFSLNLFFSSPGIWYVPCSGRIRDVSKVSKYRTTDWLLHGSPGLDTAKTRVSPNAGFGRVNILPRWKL